MEIRNKVKNKLQSRSKCLQLILQMQRSSLYRQPLQINQWASQVALEVKSLPLNAGDIRDLDSIPGLERSPGGEHGNPLQYSCLESLHGQRSLAGYSPWGHKELDTTELLSTT